MTNEDLMKIQAKRTKITHSKPASGEWGAISVPDASEIDNIWAYLIESGLAKPGTPNIPDTPSLPQPPSPPDPNTPPAPGSPSQIIEQMVNNILNKYMTTVLPIGVMMFFIGDTIPNGWLKCDGSLVTKAAYTELFAIVGDKFKKDTDTDDTMFRLPTMDNAIINSKNI